jgi:HNH endonuclease/EVE domain
MVTYLVTWNPSEWDWDDVSESCHSVKSGESISIRWSCGNTKKIRKGDRIFLLRQGIEPKGICASGYVIKEPYEDVNFRGKLSRHIKFEFDVLLNPETDKIVPRHLLNEPQFSGVHWDTQRSGITIPEEVAAELEKYWKEFSSETSNGDNSECDGLESIQEELESKGYFNPNDLEDGKERINTSIVQRRGQSKFRQNLLNAYGKRCPITDCDVEAAIEAAHIIPYRGEKSNHVVNGLPLRADVHVLFDLHLLSIHPDSHKVVLSNELIASHCYCEYKNRKLREPLDDSAVPDRMALKEHYNIFLQKNSSS